MAGSLKDQLLKIGLADKKQANKAQEQKRQAAKQSKTARKAGQQQDNAQAKQLEQARLEKQARDRELNRQREAAMAARADAGKVRQWIEQNRIEIPASADLPYNFVEARKIKKIYVTKQQMEELARGHLAIALSGERHVLIPDVIAARIQLIDEQAVIRITPEEAPTEDDPYADYQIPDDLMW